MRRRKGRAMSVSKMARIIKASMARADLRNSLGGKYQSNARIIATKQPMKYAYTFAMAWAMTSYSSGSFRAIPINQTNPAPTAGKSTPTRNCQFMPASLFESCDCRSSHSKGQPIHLQERAHV